MIFTKNLGLEYDSTTKFVFPDLTINPNEPLLILGKSGSGKTTLLNILGLISKPDKGKYNLNGVECLNLNGKQLVDFRGQNIGFVFQKSYFIKSLSVFDNINLANYLAKNKIQKNKVLEISKSLGIDHLLFKNIQLLSGGEQQRVSIARALVNTPKIILADEPTSALDDFNCEKVTNLLIEESKKIGAALVIVTHDNRLKQLFNNHIILQ